MSTDFAKRLKAARAHAGLTQEELAAKAGLKQSSIGDLESKGHGSKRTATMAAACGVSALWLESGEGVMTPDEAAMLAQLPRGIRRYPVLTSSQAVARSEAGEGLASLGTEVSANEASVHAFFLQLAGNSMTPEFREGDRVLIDPDITPQPGDYVAAKYGKNETLFRKYRLLGHDESGEEIFELMPLNQDHPVMRSDNYGLSLIGTMLELRRKFPRD
ncbi:LexA family protein [Delftia acidovorans]